MVFLVLSGRIEAFELYRDKQNRSDRIVANRSARIVSGRTEAFELYRGEQKRSDRSASSGLGGLWVRFQGEEKCSCGLFLRQSTERLLAGMETTMGSQKPDCWANGAIC